MIVEGLPYAFPAAHLEVAVRPSKGATYVALRPPGEDLILVNDERVDRKQKREGRPIVSRINYSDYSKVDVVERAGETVFCGSGLRFDCGFKIDDAGIQWSVRFDRDRLWQVAAIRQRATALIKSYRRS